MGMNRQAERFAQATAAARNGDWHRALELAQELVRHAPASAAAHYLAGIAALQLQQVPLAIGYLRGAATLDPARAEYAIRLASALSHARLHGEAKAAADAAMQLGIEDPLGLDTAGVVYTRANAHELAVSAFGRATALRPDHAGLRFNFASGLAYLGQIDEAEREYEACLALDPRQWRCYLALSQLRRQQPGTDHVDRFAALMEQYPDEPHARLYLNMALGKELEDLGDFPRAFRHYAAGKSAARRELGHDPAQDRSLFEALMRLPSPDQPAADARLGEGTIFVFGMPRTGTTLVDRILSSHSMVRSAGELEDFGVAFKRATGSATPRVLDVDTIRRTDRVDWMGLGQAYLASSASAAAGARYFIDKLPHNFLYAGLIARALPGARMVCLRRDPLDTCLGNFRQLFALTSPFHGYSFDLLDTGGYYVLFDRLMAHWRATMPGRILEIRYEDIVEAQEDSSRRLLAHCGLPWEDACLAFERNAAPVSTASLAQVRRPIYRDSIGLWRRYESEAGELRALLREAGIEC